MHRTAFAALAIFVVACSSSSSGNPAAGTDGGSSPTGTAITSAGGTATGADGAQLVVPAGALTTTTTFAIAEAKSGDSFPSAPPAGLTFAGKVYAFTPHGTAFAMPATVVVPFTASSASVLLHAEEGDTSWSMLNLESAPTGSLSAEVTSLSFIVAANPMPGVDAGSDAGCSGKACTSTADCCANAVCVVNGANQDQCEVP